MQARRLSPWWKTSGKSSMQETPSLTSLTLSLRGIRGNSDFPSIELFHPAANYPQLARTTVLPAVRAGLTPFSLINRLARSTGPPRGLSWLDTTTTTYYSLALDWQVRLNPACRARPSHLLRQGESRLANTLTPHHGPRWVLVDYLQDLQAGPTDHLHPTMAKVALPAP